MKIIRRTFINILLFNFISFASNSPQLYHQQVEELAYNQFDRITCFVEPGSLQINSVKIFIRFEEGELFNEYTMVNDKGVYTFRIIPEMVRSDSFYYFITAEFSDYSIFAYPADNPEENLIVVPVVEPKRVAKKIAVKDVEKIYCDLGRNIGKVRSVTIYTHYGKNGRYSLTPMALSGGHFQYNVSPPSEKNQILFYYIVIKYMDHTLLSYPSDDLDNNPITGYYRDVGCDHFKNCTEKL
ncbi:hypothetical protein KJ656_10180 [bacterium]|nr:hypothetical protein [bacterium]